MDLAKFKEVSKMSREELMEYIAQSDPSSENTWENLFDSDNEEPDDRSRRILRIMFPNADLDDDFEEALEHDFFSD